MADIRDFISCLKHTRGEFAGQPFELFPWQQEYLDKLFNTKRPDGLRQYRQSLLALGRKNGKTQMSAGIGLFGLVADNEPGAEIICVAGDREQASILFAAAKQMVEGNETLSSIIKPYRSSLAVPSTNSVLKVVSSEAASKHGYGCSMILFDEFHVQKDRELYDVLTTSTVARRQPLTILITTAGFDRNTICFQIWEYALKVRDGIITDPTFLPCIYAAPPDADPFDEETWKLANPNYGVTVKAEYLREMAARARVNTSDEMTLRRLHLNQWTASEEKFFRHGVFQACGEPLRPRAKRPCYCALDLGSVYDTSAFACVWPDADGSVDVEVMFWIPGVNAEKRDREDRVPYTQWAKQGFVRLTEGEQTNYEEISDYILKFAAENWVKHIAVDKWNAMQTMVQLAAEGLPVSQFAQTPASYNYGTRLLENLVNSKKLRHGGNPVLNWQADNLQVKANQEGLIKPAKKHSHDIGRIDGIQALCAALSVMSGFAEHGESAEPTIMVI